MMHGVVPHALTRLEVEVVQLTALAFAGLPVLWERRLETLSRDPRKGTVRWELHAEPLAVLFYFALARFVLGIEMVLEDD